MDQVLTIALWHVHGSWTTAFVQGPHRYLIPVLPDRGPYGLGRARTWDWPASVTEVTPAELATADIDVAVLQRPEETVLLDEWSGRRAGRELPAIFLEHNAPLPHAVEQRHPLADQHRIPIVHVTHFNRLMWDNGRAPTTVIEHGVVDPGPLYTGELPRQAVVINDPATRGRTVGADLVSHFAAVAPVDIFGMRVTRFAAEHSPTDHPITPFEDLAQAAMHREMARRRVYVHPMRWTSLGLSLIEAMHLAMPVVAVASTAAADAVDPAGGIVSADVGRLAKAVGHFLGDAELARKVGATARSYALGRFGLDRFLTDWNRLLAHVADRREARI